MNTKITTSDKRKIHELYTPRDSDSDTSVPTHISVYVAWGIMIFLLIITILNTLTKEMP